ncbi:WUSCHEL related homeobox 14 [Rhynchospora pubera]|uniref:WUSCHEL related homeobox 14 n=1 Tax=Rhynchospora pubera TaxID=906938 RepID=A0AAV8EYX2_9POAL|nr:WUSCHEL related homeobox 14 [Rhynchospora pubera]
MKMNCPAEVKSIEECHLPSLMGNVDLELCRRQLSTYAWICERLYKICESGTIDLASLEATGINTQTVYNDLFSGNRGLNALAPKKSQWNPTSEQLTILDYYHNQEFSSSNIRISFKRVKQITTELLPYGHAIDLDVYDWFLTQRAH